MNDWRWTKNKTPKISHFYFMNNSVKQPNYDFGISQGSVVEI